MMLVSFRVSCFVLLVGLSLVVDAFFTDGTGVESRTLPRYRSRNNPYREQRQTRTAWSESKPGAPVTKISPIQEMLRESVPNTKPPQPRSAPMQAQVERRFQLRQPLPTSNAASPQPRSPRMQPQVERRFQQRQPLPTSNAASPQPRSPRMQPQVERRFQQRQPLPTFNAASPQPRSPRMQAQVERRFQLRQPLPTSNTASSQPRSSSMQAQVERRFQQRQPLPTSNAASPQSRSAPMQDQVERRFQQRQPLSTSNAASPQPRSSPMQTQVERRFQQRQPLPTSNAASPQFRSAPMQDQVERRFQQRQQLPTSNAASPQPRSSPMQAQVERRFQQRQPLPTSNAARRMAQLQRANDPNMSRRLEPVPFTDPTQPRYRQFQSTSRFEGRQVESTPRFKPKPRYKPIQPERMYKLVQPESQYKPIQPEPQYQQITPEQYLKPVMPSSASQTGQPSSEYIIVSGTPDYIKDPPATLIPSNPNVQTNTIYQSAFGQRLPDSQIMPQSNIVIINGEIPKSSPNDAVTGPQQAVNAGINTQSIDMGNNQVYTMSVAYPYQMSAPDPTMNQDVVGLPYTGPAMSSMSISNPAPWMNPFSTNYQAPLDAPLSTSYQAPLEAPISTSYQAMAPAASNYEPFVQNQPLITVAYMPNSQVSDPGATEQVITSINSAPASPDIITPNFAAATQNAAQNLAPIIVQDPHYTVSTQNAAQNLAPIIVQDPRYTVSTDAINSQVSAVAVGIINKETPTNVTTNQSLSPPPSASKPNQRGDPFVALMDRYLTYGDVPPHMATKIRNGRTNNDPVYIQYLSQLLELPPQVTTPLPTTAVGHGKANNGSKMLHQEPVEPVEPSEIPATGRSQGKTSTTGAVGHVAVGGSGGYLSGLSPFDRMLARYIAESLELPPTQMGIY